MNNRIVLGVLAMMLLIVGCYLMAVIVVTVRFNKIDHTLFLLQESCGEHSPGVSHNYFEDDGSKQNRFENMKVWSNDDSNRN